MSVLSDFALGSGSMSVDTITFRTVGCLSYYCQDHCRKRGSNGADQYCQSPLGPSIYYSRVTMSGRVCLWRSIYYSIAWNFTPVPAHNLLYHDLQDFHCGCCIDDKTLTYPLKHTLFFHR